MTDSPEAESAGRPRARIASTEADSAWRSIMLALGVTMVVGSVVTNIPDNAWLSWKQHQVAGKVFSHTAVALVVLGLWPRLLAALPLAARVSHSREWGLVEPVQFAAYGVGALICREAARALERDHPRRSLYRAGVVVLAVLMLEEIDYLGLGSGMLNLFGATRGRIDGVYVGALHDLLNLAVQYSVIALIPVFALLALALPWLRRQWPVLVAELRSSTSAPLIPAMALMALAQIDDIVGFPGLRFGSVGPVVAFEEPLELLALLCLNASLVLKFCRELSLSRRC
jgi:hypothetical protein